MARHGRTADLLGYVLPPIKMLIFLFLTATKTNHIQKCLNFQKKLIDTITTSNFYSKLKENNENDMDAQAFWSRMIIFVNFGRPSGICLFIKPAVGYTPQKKYFHLMPPKV